MRGVAGNLKGTIFNDADGNGKVGSKEKPMAKVKVFLDYNSNGTRDANEPQATTAKDGTYTFKNVGPGVYKLRAVLPSGMRTSNTGAAAYRNVTVTSGKTARIAGPAVDHPRGRQRLDLPR